MTKEEFMQGYAERSGVTVKWLIWQRQDAFPCDCEEDGCEGWQMRNIDDFPEAREDALNPGVW